MAESILIIEDDELMRASLELELEAAGYRVRSVASGLQAIEHAREQHFDLIVSDVRMEGMSGLEALSAMRDLQPAARKIVITGYANPDAPITALKMGVDDYLLKPFSSDELLRSVRAALEQLRRGSRSVLGVREVLLSLASQIGDPARQQRTEEILARCLSAARGHGFSYQRTQGLHLLALLHDVDPALLERLDELRPVAGWLRLSQQPQASDLPLEAVILAEARGTVGQPEAVIEVRGPVGQSVERVDQVIQEQPGVSLAHLADTYRAAGQLDLAERAYQEAALLLTAPEQALPLELERAELSRLRGQTRQALERLEEVSRQASAQGLDLLFAQAELQRARLGDGAASLPRAIEVFRRWEARAELARALMLLSEPPLEELLCLLSDWSGEWREELLEVLIRALERFEKVEEIGRFLKRAGQPLAAELRHHPQPRVRLLVEELVPEKAAVPDASGWQLQLLGRFELKRGGEVLADEVWPTRKTRHLFAFLAWHRGRPQDEETLTALFWDQSPDKARHSLHNAISQVRKVLAAPGWLVKKRGGYLLTTEVPLRVDVEEFLECEARGRQLAAQGLLGQAVGDLQKAEQLYRGDFLEGEFPEWAEPVRLTLKTRFLEVLGALGRHFYRQGKPEVAQDFFRKMLQNDNCSEEAYLGLMACQLAQQQTSEAIKTYHQCTRVLQSELSLPPPPRLLELYLRVVDGQMARVEL